MSDRSLARNDEDAGLVMQADEQIAKHASAEMLLERLAPILPNIRERIPAADQARDTPAETIAELTAADLLRLFQPRRWGGFEADPRTYFALQNAIARVCPSTAWVYGVLSVQSFLVGLFDERAQADVWSRNPRALIASAGAPPAPAERVEGGYRLSGRWTFSSGSSHADWVLLGGRLPGPPPAAGPPAVTMFLAPREDFEIVDVWNAFGLRATGSNDIVATDIFVPDHRVLTLEPGIQNVGHAARPGPALYRIPWLYIFSTSISNLAVGTARGALDGFLAITRSRVSALTGKVAREDPAVLQVAGRLASEIDAVEAMYERHVQRLFDYDAIDTPMPMPEAVLLRTQLTGALRRLTAIVDDMMLLQGARATDLASPVTRAWLDLTAARAHLGNDPTMATTMLGTMLMAQQEPPASGSDGRPRNGAGA